MGGGWWFRCGVLSRLVSRFGVCGPGCRVKFRTYRVFRVKLSLHTKEKLPRRKIRNKGQHGLSDIDPRRMSTDLVGQQFGQA